MNRRGFALALALMGASIGVKVPNKVEIKSQGISWADNDADPIKDIQNTFYKTK